jgi:hypothetical protein
MVTATSKLLGTFEEKGERTRQQAKRAFVVALVSFIVLLSQVLIEEPFLPCGVTALAAFLLLFVGLTFIVYLIKIAFMRRGTLEIYKDGFTYHNRGSIIVRRDERNTYPWKDLTNYEHTVHREMGLIGGLDWQVAIFQAVLAPVMRLLFGNPERDNLILSVADGSVFKMADLSGDRSFLRTDLQGLIISQWIQGTLHRLRNGESIGLAKITLAPEGIRHGRHTLNWQDAEIEYGHDSRLDKLMVIISTETAERRSRPFAELDLDPAGRVFLEIAKQYAPNRVRD